MEAADVEAAVVEAAVPEAGVVEAAGMEAVVVEAAVVGVAVAVAPGALDTTVAPAATMESQQLSDNTPEDHG